jgi:hypothetical protein
MRMRTSAVQRHKAEKRSSISVSASQRRIARPEVLFHGIGDTCRKDICDTGVLEIPGCRKPAWSLPLSCRGTSGRAGATAHAVSRQWIYKLLARDQP